MSAAAASSIESIREILEGGQPWFPLAKHRGDIAEILFDADEDADAQALAREVREHGFEADVHHTVALSGHVPDVLRVTIEAAAGWAMGKILDGTISPALKWLVGRLRSERSGGVRPHEALLFQQRMRPWSTRTLAKAAGATTLTRWSSARSGATRSSRLSRNGRAGRSCSQFRGSTVQSRRSPSVERILRRTRIKGC